MKDRRVLAGLFIPHGVKEIRVQLDQKLYLDIDETTRLEDVVKEAFRAGQERADHDAEVERGQLREALQFYANHAENTNEDGIYGRETSPGFFLHDDGRKARKALKGVT